MFYVYILRSNSRKYIYVGLAKDVKKRFLQHQRGLNKTTKAYGPFELIRTESFETRIEARKREKYLKSGSGKEWIKLML